MFLPWWIIIVVAIILASLYDKLYRRIRDLEDQIDELENEKEDEGEGNDWSI